MKPDFSKIAIATAGKTKTTGISPFSELEISKVYPNPDQPRKQFDDIEELAATIKEHGLLQPITVVKKDDRYMIISGERRYKAHLHNEAKTIKAYILDKTDEQIEELALIENIQRNDLTDYETAKGVVKLWESGRYAKKSDLAEKLGKKDSYISKAFSTLKLDTSIIEDIEQNNSDISLSVIDEIARVKDPVVQKEVYKKYSDGEITRDEIKDFKEPKKTIKEKKDYAKEHNLIYDEKNDWYKIPEKSQTKPINHTLERFEDADNEYYELKIKEISTFTNEIKDYKNEISFMLEMTKNTKDAFKSKFDGFIEKKCKLLEIGKYYEVTIRPNGKVYCGVFQDPNYDKNRIDEISALKQKIQELEKEIEELNNKEVYIVGYREIIGSAMGGGFRCRALNENEAIEIAKKERYPELENDKNIIWEARTLKSHCNSENIFNDWIGYGFGTVNDMGTYIGICEGDFEGTITFEKNGDFIKTTNNKEYQVIIKELDKKVEEEENLKKK